ncbi:MAG: type II secretion system protein [Planctomycetaceae bacterium]|nr:type II secretion system protein [Planctomycetaceae bacterium]
MRQTGRSSGVSLIELVVVVTIIAILATVAASRVIDIRSDAQINATFSEANRLNRLAMTARALIGRLPNDVNQGVVPSELRPALFASSFSSPTPAGGLWDWNGPGTTMPHLGMSIFFTSTTAEPAGMYAKLDAKFDDGSANSGKIRRHVAGSRVLWCFLID